MREVQNYLLDEHEPAKTGRIRAVDQKKSIKPLIVLTVSLLSVTLMVGIFFLTRRTASPLDTFNKRVEYSIYYPSKLPSGYSFDEGVAKLDAGVLMYSLSYNGDKIIITQQAALAQDKSLRIDGFTSVATPNGTMQLGANNNIPTAVIAAPKTLITITGSTNVSKDTIADIANKLLIIAK